MGGRGRFYGEDGNPVLLKSELIKGKAILRFGVYRTLLASKPFILDFYEGTVYLTDRRVIGIRKPDPKQAALSRLSYTADFDVLETADKMKLIIEKGGYEFFSVDFEEITKIRKYRLYGAVELIAPDSKTGKELKIGIAPEKKFKALFGEDRYGLWLDTYGGKK
jgi:hypothetical protein